MPNSIIRDPNLSSIEFLVLIKLKQLQFINRSSNFKFNSKEHLKIPLDINDNRTLHRTLNNLYDNRYILEPVKIDSHSIGTVSMNDALIKSKSKFTHIYTSLLDKMLHIQANGIRLLCYYESYINRNDKDKPSSHFCFTSIDTISQETGLSRKTIIKYNSVLEKANLLDIDKHKLGTDYRYDDKDKVIFNKYNNHYYVRLENIL